MSRSGDASKIDVRALLERGNRVPQQPETVRARVLARARATAASPLPPLQPAPQTPFPRHLATPAAAVTAAGAIAATVFSLSGTWSHPAPGPSTSSQVTNAAPALTATLAPTPAPAPLPTGPSAVPPSRAPAQARASRSEPLQASYEAELGLIRSAHASYASHDFANALAMVGEHAQRFPQGLLAEEREALRIRSLAGTGRTKDAERAVSAFARRFPRSVLLPRLRAELGAGSD
jgi:hypothetical protein